VHCAGGQRQQLLFPAQEEIARPFAFPAEFLINNGEIYKIRDEETYDDLLAKQIVPEHLK